MRHNNWMIMGVFGLGRLWDARATKSWFANYFSTKYEKWSNEHFS